MLKVLQVTGTMNRGGAEVMLMDILRNKPDNVHFDFLVNNPPEDLKRVGAFDEEILTYGCKIRHIGTQLRIGPLNYIRKFKKVYNELRPDVVHIHLNAKCGIIALAAHLAGCKKIITHCHADIRFRGSFLSRLFNESEMFFQKFLIMLYGTDWWGCSVEANRRLYWPWIRERSVVINNSINLDAYEQIREKEVSALRDSYNLPKGALVLGNVGRIVPHKNIAFVVDVMSELKKRGTDAVFVIAGRNDTPEYTKVMLQKAERLGIPSNCFLFLGERSDIPIVMHTFDVFVGPALKEGFGMVAVEAQAAGVPCVLNEGFPQTVDMKVGLCQRLANFNVVEWCNAIEQFKSLRVPVSRDSVHSAIQLLGFDVKDNALKVCKLYFK